MGGGVEELIDTYGLYLVRTDQEEDGMKKCNI